MFDTSSSNPKVPAFLQIVTSIESLVVGVTATVLFFLPALGNQIWAWAVPPYNSRYIGAIYYAALLPLVVFAISGRWAPGRLVTWMIFAFTTSIGVVMFVHIPSFDWARFATYAFWFLYIFLPLNSVFFLYRLRQLEPGGVTENSAMWRNVLLAVMVVLGLYGLGLLVAPEAVTSFWPWKIDAFHGRIYAATFLTPALGAWIIHKRGAPSERVVLGLTLVTLGVLSIVGVMWASATVPPERQVNYASLGTWAFFGMNVITALVGTGIATSARKLSRPEDLPQRARGDQHQRVG